MDTLTHALSGALAGRAAGPRRPAPDTPPAHVRGWLGFAAAAFPDIDFALRFVDTLIYLEHHRATTHSLVLLPLWALAVGAAAWAVLGRRYRLAPLAAIAALAIAVHIAGDLITAYGTRILAPFSDFAPAPAWVLVVDPWLTGTLALALLASLRWPRPPVAAAGLAVVAVLVGFQAGINEVASRIGDRHATAIGWTGARVRALAQPLSPFNRAVIIERDGTYLRARINLLRSRHRPAADDTPRLWRLYRSYRPATAPRWQRFRLLPEDAGTNTLATRAWRSAALAPFRRFAHHPVFYGAGTNAEGDRCAWFTDLRYWYDPLPAPFRFGACHGEDDGSWRLDRLPFDWREWAGKAMDGATPNRGHRQAPGAVEPGSAKP